MNELPLQSSESSAVAVAKRRRRGGTRRRTGCDTCKSRHTKCDEEKPICGNCKRLDLHCRQPSLILRFKGRPPDEPRRGAARHVSSSAVDQQASILETGAAGSASPPSPTVTWVDFNTNPSESSFSALTPGGSQSRVGGAVLLTPEMVHLLKRYQTGVATWMDMFDGNCTYQREILRRCTGSTLLVHSVCAFTAKHLSLLPAGEVWEHAANCYYSRALQALLEQIRRGASHLEDTLTATMLLASYEITADQDDAHKPHFDGATRLITTRGISASSTGMDLANFWIYIRHEIFVALVNEAPLQIEPRSWKVIWREKETDEHALGNHILWLVGRAIDVVYRLGTPSERRKDIQTEAAKWFDGLPASFHGTRYSGPDDQGFCKLYFAVPASAAAMLLYHLLHLLLLAERRTRSPAGIEEELRQPRPASERFEAAQSRLQIEHHATEIANIGISDLPQCVRNFSVQATFFAAKHISGTSRKLRLYNMLMDIEQHVGFGTQKRMKRLEELLSLSG